MSVCSVLAVESRETEQVQEPENLANNIGLVFIKGSQYIGKYPGEKAERTDSVPSFFSGDTRKT